MNKQDKGDEKSYNHTKINPFDDFLVCLIFKFQEKKSWIHEKQNKTKQNMDKDEVKALILKTEQESWNL